MQESTNLHNLEGHRILFVFGLCQWSIFKNKELKTPAVKAQTMHNSKNRMIWNVILRHGNPTDLKGWRQFGGSPNFCHNSIVIQTVRSAGSFNGLHNGWLSLDSSYQVPCGALLVYGLTPTVFIPLKIPNHTHSPLLTSPACRHLLSRDARVPAQRMWDLWWTSWH